MKDFGEFLSNLRSSSGLSLEELAGLVGTSRSTLSRLENEEVPRPFKGSIRKLVLALAETLCTSQKETERYLALAGIKRSLLTETEEIRLGFISHIAPGSPEEVTSLERLRSICKQRLHELEAQASSGSLPHLRLKIQEYAQALGEAWNRLNFLSRRHEPNTGQPISTSPREAPSTRQLEEHHREDALHETLAAYLQQQRANLLDTPAPGAAHLRMRDIVEAGGLFIPPPWKQCSGATRTEDVAEYLIDAISQGGRVLLLGEAGQGKTTVLKRAFTLMTDRFLLDPRETARIPLYVPLREIAAFARDPIEILWEGVSGTLPLPFEHFAALVYTNRVIFLFDGFDEIRGELTQRSINERVSSEIFAYPGVLSCRKNFYESYLSISAIQERYPQWVELQPLTLTHSVQEYIHAFCRKKREGAAQRSFPLPEYIVKTIEASPELRDLAQRPLLLVMMLDLFSDPEEAGEHEWNAAKLYERYTEKWLKHEAAKPDSVLKWHEKATLIQEIAWSIHAARVANASLHERYHNGTITQHDLFLLLERLSLHFRHIPLAQIFDDICLRTFLIANDGDTYYLIHKSFQEYYVAKYIFGHLRSREQPVGAAAHVLGEFISMEVGIFLKAMLDAKKCSSSERDYVVDVLIAAYRQNSMDDQRSVTIRENASHYLAFLGTPKATRFLEQAYAAEPNKWVQRGMMVGLALLCQKSDILDRYIDLILNDPEVASINIGYHLVYYGDQAPEEGYHDRGGQRCEGTLRSIFRRLKSEHYRSGWALDLLTLRTLLEQRGVKILDTDEYYRPFLAAFLDDNHQGQSSAFQREKQRLQEILEGAIRR